MSLTFTIEPKITEQLLNSISVGKDSGQILMEKQWDSLQGKITLREKSTGYLVEEFEVDNSDDKNLTGNEFRSMLSKKAIELAMAASA